MMKIKYGCEWLSVENESDMDKVEVSLMDDGYWEYNRCGVGMNKGKVFIVDLDDCGEKWREVGYCEKVKSVEECLKIGVECGVFVEFEDGYGDGDEFRVKMDCENDSWDKFKELVGIKEGYGSKLYCEYEKV